jgi:RNA polymerase sigma factor (sigma-70 family)
MTPADAERLEQALAQLAEERRNEAAWSVLIELTYPIALGTANRILRGNLDLAKDSASESFARIARYANFEVLSLQDRGAFTRYLKQVTRRTSLDLVKRLARYAPEIQSDPMFLEAIASSDSQTPADMLVAKELVDEIKGILDADETALLELMLKETPLDQMATQLGISYSALGVRRHRLRAKIAKHLRGRR